MVEPHSTYSALRAIEIFQRLGKTGLGEEMIEPWWQLRAQFEMLGPELLGDLLQGLQMRRRIAVPEGMVGNESEPTLKKGAQWIKGGHACIFLRRKRLTTSFSELRLWRGDRSHLTANDAVGLGRTFVNGCLLYTSRCV